MAEHDSYSVMIRNGCKHYNSEKSPVMVLKNMNMIVKHGTIYGLLGASGCGKTTLLRCIVGRHKLDSGEINVLGKGVNDINSQALGRWIGYMPQELALYEYFTIGEILTYFGLIHQMSIKDIKSESLFLENLMHLPKKDKLIQTLSGGQKRRVSFACALIHDPDLLILDEPTVGIDPVLRESIWKHFTQIVESGNKTILLTTHYIEEARQADTVGLMRNGQLLVEASPTKLLHLYRCQTLEEVFLQLCVRQDSEVLQKINGCHSTTADDIELQNIEMNTQTEQISLTSANEINEVDCGSSKTITSRKHKKSSNSMYIPLIAKAVLYLWRYPSIIPFLILLPFMQATVMCFSIGKLPEVIRLAVVNDEMISSSSGYQCSQTEDGCVTTNIGCHFLANVGNSLFTKDYYTTLDEAKASVLQGEAWSMIHFPENFSQAFVNRFQYFTDEYSLNQSIIEVWYDSSSVLINGILKKYLYDDFERFIVKWSTECGMGLKHGLSSLKFEEPVYGSNSISYLDSIVPYLISGFSFFISFPLASSIYIKEKEEQTWERNIVSGVSKLQIIVAYLIVNAIIIVIQDVLLYVCFLYIFGVNCKDNAGLGILFMFILGITGLSTGTALSLIFTEYITYFQCIMGMMQATMQLSGIIWPLEAENIYLKYFSYILPVTLGSQTMRNIMLREWTFIDSDTIYGLYVCIVYICLSWCFVIIKMRNS